MIFGKSFNIIIKYKFKEIPTFYEAMYIFISP